MPESYKGNCSYSVNLPAKLKTVFPSFGDCIVIILTQNRRVVGCQNEVPVAALGGYRTRFVLRV